jgi:hypothetical protein
LRFDAKNYAFGLIFDDRIALGEGLIFVYYLIPSVYENELLITDAVSLLDEGEIWVA